VKVVYFDCPSGASGDMILGALLDAGVPLDALRAELAKLAVAGFRLEAREVRRGAFRAIKADVVLEQATRHEHRQLRDILAILGASQLPPTVVARATQVFTRLAEAEAQVHGSRVDEIHFHEVGAVDAIVDVTGAVIGLHLLGADGVHVSALPVGAGFVEGAHGRMPVPAPGTAELLRGFPVVDSGVRAELVTPTGAAILTTLATGSGRMPAMTLDRVGYGAGTKDFPGAPNILRCFVGEVTEASSTETVAQVETTIDDMNPQLYEPLMDRLFEAGALDVFLTPVVMKRSRPGTVLTALCPRDKVPDLSRVLFEESSTIGVRWTDVSRIRLEREMTTIVTDYGPLPFKVSRLDGRIVTVTPEFSDVVRLARDKALPVREVLAQAQTAARRHLNPTP
jgi:pyridinium-3,5-bisthiocarboxylic acid mononucleotide nickel chelatase